LVERQNKSEEHSIYPVTPIHVPVWHDPVGKKYFCWQLLDRFFDYCEHYFSKKKWQEQKERVNFQTKEGSLR
jgi:hypothetical protein